jgi:hypothetical protein
MFRAGVSRGNLGGIRRTGHACCPWHLTIRLPCAHGTSDGPSQPPRSGPPPRCPPTRAQATARAVSPPPTLCVRVCICVCACVRALCDKIARAEVTAEGGGGYATPDPTIHPDPTTRPPAPPSHLTPFGTLCVPLPLPLYHSNQPTGRHRLQVPLRGALQGPGGRRG